MNTEEDDEDDLQLPYPGIDVGRPEPTQPRLKKVPTFTRADQVPDNAPLASQAKAQIRRHVGDPRQLAWEIDAVPKRMLFALRNELMHGARAYHAALANEIHLTTGGRAGLTAKHAVALTNTSVTLRLRNADGVVRFAQDLKAIISTEGNDHGLARAVCNAIRTVHPNAPSDYVVPEELAPTKHKEEPHGPHA